MLGRSLHTNLIVFKRTKLFHDVIWMFNLYSPNVCVCICVNVYFLVYILAVLGFVPVFEESLLAVLGEPYMELGIGQRLTAYKEVHQQM